MYMLWYAYNPYIVVAFFIILVLFGVFFVLNLFLAVISDNFQNVNSKQEKAEALTKVKVV